MRYSSNKVAKDKNSKPYQTSYIIKNIPYSPEDRFVEVTTTDRLDLIAHKYYGNRDFWWIIAAANNIGKGTLNIDEGVILRLPANPQSINSKNNNSALGY